MAKTEQLSAEQQKERLLQATQTVFEQYGFATKNMLETEAKHLGVEKGVGQFVYGNLRPVLEGRQDKNPAVISTFNAITNNFPVRKAVYVRENGQEVEVFYLPERFQTAPDGSTRTENQTRDEALRQYKAFEEARVAAVKEREQHKANVKAEQEGAARRRREEALAPSKARLTLLAYRKGTHPEDFERISAEQRLKEPKRTHYEMPDYSDAYGSLTNVLELSFAQKVLEKGLMEIDLHKVLDAMRIGIIRTANVLQQEANEIVPQILQDLTTKLAVRNGKDYNAVTRLQRQYVPLVAELLKREIEASGANVDATIPSWNDYSFRTYPTQAAYKWIGAAQTGTSDAEVEKSREVLNDDFLYHVLFFDLICQMYFPYAPLLGEQGEVMAAGIHLIVDQFSQEEIVGLLTVPTFDQARAQCEFDEADKRISDLMKQQAKGRRVSRDVMKKAESQRKQALQILEQRSYIKPDEVTKRIKAAIQAKIPFYKPSPQDYEEQNGEESRAYILAKANYERQIKQGITYAKEPVREEYIGGETSRAFSRDDGLYQTMDWIRRDQRSLAGRAQGIR